MDPINTENVKPLSSRSTQIFILAIIGVQVLVALLSYPFLPDTVPTHWDAAGEVNGYGPKWVDTFLFPLITLGIYMLIRFLLSISPRIGSEGGGQRANVEVVDRILISVFLVLLVVQLTILAVIFHLPVDISFVICMLLSVNAAFYGKLPRQTASQLLGWYSYTVDSRERYCVGKDASLCRLALCGNGSCGYCVELYSSNPCLGCDRSVSVGRCAGSGVFLCDLSTSGAERKKSYVTTI